MLEGAQTSTLPWVLLYQVVHDGGRGDRLPRARRSLDQRQRPLQRRLHGEHLRPVQLGQVRRGEVFGEMAAEQHLVDLVTQQAVVDVRRDRLVVHGELLQRRLHTVERRRLPHKVHHEVVRAVQWDARVGLQLDADLVTSVVGYLDDMPDSGPRFVSLPQVSDPQLVTMHEAHVSVRLGHAEVGDGLLVEALVPAHLDVVLRLRLLQLLVVVGLQLHQGTEDVLVLVSVLVSAMWSSERQLP